MKAASLDSPRLQRVLGVLADGRERSTLDIIDLAGVCAVNSCIAELRTHGAVIDCRVSADANGRRIWLYRLIEPPREAA